MKKCWKYIHNGHTVALRLHINVLVQDGGNSIAKALE